MSKYKQNDNLISDAEDAIDEVFSDSSVPLEETLNAMSSLMSFIATKIAALKADIARKGKL